MVNPAVHCCNSIKTGYGCQRINHYCPAMKKILLCNKHPFIRHAIKTMLEAAFNGVQIEEEVNRNALLRLPQ